MDYFDRELREQEEDLERLTKELGKKLLILAKKEAQSIWKPFYWKQLPMLWLGENAVLRDQMLKFVSRYPALKNSEEKIDCLKKYFLEEAKTQLFILKLVPFVEALPFGRKLIAGIVDLAIRGVARRFIVGDSAKEISKALKKLEKEGASYNLDVVGEEVLSEEEAEKYLGRYISMFRIAKAEVSLKPSGLCSDFGSKSTVENLKARLRRIFRESVAGVTVDIEQYRYRDFTFQIFKEVLAEEEFRNFNGAGIAFQVYFKDWFESLKGFWKLLSEKRQVKIRLVKGAYWDSEVAEAKQKNHLVHVFTEKWQSDVAFERACQILMWTTMFNDNRTKIAIASHNVRSVAKVMALAKTFNFPKERLEFQVLYGMGYPLMRAIVKMGYPVKVYVPIGEVVKGVAYLVRRIVENTSQGSFVFQSFDKKVPIEELLKNPAENLKP